MPTTVLLVRWNGGWHEVVDLDAETAYGRSEGFLSLGAVQSVGEAERLANAELTGQFGRIREQYSAEHAPVDLDEIPYVAYGPADRISAPAWDDTPTTVQVQEMTIAEDENGELTFRPTLGDRILGIDEVQRELLLALDEPQEAR